MVEATHVGDREQLQSGQRRFLDWVQLPVAFAAIAAVFSHAVVRLLEPFRIRADADFVSSIAAVLALTAVLAYRLGHSIRKS